jgi:hypothetical protein
MRQFFALKLQLFTQYIGALLQFRVGNFFVETLPVFIGEWGSNLPEFSRYILIYENLFRCTLWK